MEAALAHLGTPESELAAWASRALSATVFRPEAGSGPD
jgi:hypothetical protein